MMDDRQLLARYVREGSQEAFAELFNIWLTRNSVVKTATCSNKTKASPNFRTWF